jgi:hypothetical protein
MEYRDVHHVYPDSYQWRTPSPGSYKPEPDTDSEYFKWDYKVSYKDSPYYIRRNIRPENRPATRVYSNIEFTAKDVEEYSKRIPDFKRI